MLISRKIIGLLVVCATAFAPACAKKKDSGGGGSSGKEEEEEEDADDGITSTKNDTDPCDAALMDSELTEDCGSTDDKKEDEPDSAFYEEVVNPPAMKDCTSKGLVYLRCTGECSAVKTPAKFKCDRAAIEAQYSTVQGAKEDLADYVDNKKYFIDQCGVTAANKPFVALACFATTEGGTCVDKDALDTKEVFVTTHFLTTDTTLGDLCPDQ